MSHVTRTLLREPGSAARLSQTFSRSLAAVEIAEPLISLDENQPVSVGVEALQSRKSAVLGIRHGGVVVGWATIEDLTEGTLGDHSRPFEREHVLDESAGIDSALRKFANADVVFVEWLGGVAGVITRRDLQKPPVRMWLFGAITVLDANMTWAISELYPEDAWQELVSAGRCEKARSLHAERQRIGAGCRLVDCLQIADKSEILTSDRAHIAALGLPSRKQAERLMRGIETLRNFLAHSQELEPRHLDTATKLAEAIDSILRAEGVQRLLASAATGVPAVSNSDRLNTAASP
ncbi:MAG: hypothetical protein ACO1QR_07915 [Chthoniobacteraceae bacterium]